MSSPRTDPSASRRRVGTGIVADLIVEKCGEAQPIHRERARYQRMGWDAPASTLDSAWRWGTELLVPTADVVRGEILAHAYVRAESTPLTILDPKRPSGRFKGQTTHPKVGAGTRPAHFAAANEACSGRWGSVPRLRHRWISSGSRCPPTPRARPRASPHRASLVADGDAGSGPAVAKSDATAVPMAALAAEADDDAEDGLVAAETKET